MTKREWRGWGAALALAGAIFAGLLALASRTTLWDRDEPRFAQATVEMIASGDYLVPTFNGSLRADKPILAYWWMALPMRLLGPSAVAARLGSAVAMAIAALLTFAAARRLLPAGAGLWAMAVLAATPLAVVEGQAATADALLLAAVTGALACFAAALTGDGRRPWPWLGLGLALGLAQLAKGPVGLAVPGLGIATTLAILGRRARAARTPAKPAAARLQGESQAAAPAMYAAVDATAETETAVRQEAVAAEKEGTAAAATRNAEVVPVGRYAMRAALAALLGVAIFCAWGVPANVATGGELARVGIGKHVIGRALGAMEGHGGGGWHGWRGWVAGLPFYLAVAWLGFAPWVLWLPAAVSATLGGRLGGERGRALLIGWVVPTFALMTLVATRLPHYVLPAWPALALAVGGTLEAERRGDLAPRDRRWLRRGAWLLGPLVGLAFAAVAALAVLAVFDGHAPVAGGSRADVAAVLALPCLALAVVLAVAGGRALRDHLAGRYRRAAAVLVGGALAAALVAGVAVAPEVERLKPAPRLAAAVRAATAPGVPVATFEYAEPSLTFYLRRWPVRELRDASAAAAWAAEGGPGVLVLPRSTCERLRGAPWAAGLTEIAAANGWNVAKGSRLNLVALSRRWRQMGALRKFLSGPLNIGRNMMTSTSGVQPNGSPDWVSIAAYPTEPLPTNTAAKFWAAVEPTASAATKRWLLYIHQSQDRGLVQDGYRMPVSTPGAPPLPPHPGETISVCLGSVSGTYTAYWINPADPITTAGLPKPIMVNNQPAQQTINWTGTTSCKPGGSGSKALNPSPPYPYDVALFISP